MEMLHYILIQHCCVYGTQVMGPNASHGTMWKIKDKGKYLHTS